MVATGRWFGPPDQAEVAGSAARRRKVACNFGAAPSLSLMGKLFLILMLVGIALLIGLAAFVVAI
jgi:hypothetical protein